MFDDYMRSPRRPQPHDHDDIDDDDDDDVIVDKLSVRLGFCCQGLFERY